MKRSIVFVLALMLCITLSAQTITNTNIEVNQVDYSCNGTTYTSFAGVDFGNMSQMVLNGSIRYSGTSGQSYGYMNYRINNSDWIAVALTEKTTISEDPPVKIPELPGDEGNNIEGTSLNKTLATYEIFSRPADLTVNMSELTNGATYNFDVFFRVGSVYDPNLPPPNNFYSATYTKIADVSFSDGTAFAPTITPGNTNELIGRFYLQSDVSGATLTGASIDLIGTRSGFSNFKLWASSDVSLDIGSDEYIRTVSADPGASPAVYSSFSVSIPTTGTYILLSADVDAEATGSIQGVISEAADLTVLDGEINSTISTAYMSDGGAEVPTAIELSSFTATAVKGTVVLDWITESETENSHFLIYRDGEVIGCVDGAGTTTEQHVYSYIDNAVIPGVHAYAIADVTYGGVEEMHSAVTVEVGTAIDEASFELNKAYPNPFNPLTTVDYYMGRGTHLELGVYNLQGEKVADLYSGLQEAGVHRTVWNASGSPSGIYFVRMLAGDMVRTMKVVLMK